MSGRDTTSTVDILDREHGRRGLSPGQKRIIRAFCEAFLSSIDDRGRPTMPALPLIERVVDEFDLWIGSGSSDLQRGFHLLCLVIEGLPGPVMGVFRRMTELTLLERVAYLDELEQTRIGLLSMLVVGLKLPIGTLAYEVGDELAMTGFDRRSMTIPRGDVPLASPSGWTLRGGD